MNSYPTPLVVQYLYVHEPQEVFYYPTARSSSSIARVASRYLECALTQAASLRLREVDCDLALATNVEDRRVLGLTGIELMKQIEALGVEILPTEYLHRPSDDSKIYISSRYLLDAILSASKGQPENRQLWLTDLDCVWADAERVFAAAPSPTELGCIYIDYPPDWDVVGFNEHGLTRRAIGEMAASMGGSEPIPPWVGGELMTGTPNPLRELVTVCEQLDAQLITEGKPLPTEEQILTLAGATGSIRFRDLSAVAHRISTGPRHKAVSAEDPLAFGLWHLPSEKGLSLRRAAHEIVNGRTTRLRRDLADPVRTAKRFNVAGTGLLRRFRDDGWLLFQRVLGIVRSKLGRS